MTLVDTMVYNSNVRAGLARALADDSKYYKKNCRGQIYTMYDHRYDITELSRYLCCHSRLNTLIAHDINHVCTSAQQLLKVTNSVAQNWKRSEYVLAHYSKLETSRVTMAGKWGCHVKLDLKA